MPQGLPRLKIRFAPALARLTRRLHKPRGLERILRHLAPPATFGVQDSFVCSVEGTKIRVRPSSRLGWNLYFFGTYEAMLRRLLRAYLDAGNVVLEVGANIGWHTLLMSRLVGSNGQVHAFEPSPPIAKELTRNLRLNKISNCTIHNKALAAEKGVMNFKIFGPASENAGDGHLLPNTAGALDGSSTNVPVETLDSFEYARCDLIKIDVEGFEPAVLYGGRETIRRCSPVIIFEYVQSHVERAGLLGLSLVEFFKDMEYSIYRFDDRTTPKRLNSLDGYSGDLIAVRNDHRPCV